MEAAGSFKDYVTKWSSAYFADYDKMEIVSNFACWIANLNRLNYSTTQNSALAVLH